jgi:putative ABC transport system permease protein
MSFFSILIKNLFRRKIRSLLTIIGLAVAVAAMVSLVGIASRFEQSYYELYEETGVDLVVQESGGSQMLNRGIKEEYGQKIEALPEVKKVVGGLVDVIAFEDVGLFMVVVNGWPPGSRLFEHIKITEGQTLQPGKNEEVLLGKVLAANMGKKVGDTVDMYAKPMKVVGIFESSHVYENGSVIAPLKELQTCMDRPKRVSAFLVEAKDRSAAGVESLKKQIEALVPGSTAEPMKSFVGSVSHIKVSRAMAWMTSGIALVIGAIGMLNTMAMAVHERIKEIGTLRAMGWKKGRVVRMILGESLLLSLLGAIGGSLYAVAITHYFSKFPVTAGFIDGYIAPQFIALGFLMAVFVGVVGAAYPAWWGASLSPIEALRRK